MHLDSARALKLELIAEMRERRQQYLEMRAARGRGRAVTFLRTGDVALGLCPVAPGDFRLAVRAQARNAWVTRETETAAERAHREVDFRYIGRVLPQGEVLPARWYQGRTRPLRIGASVGHVEVTAGTIGGFVTPRGGGTGGSRGAILSNNHVLALENRAAVGDLVIQPGPSDRGSAPDDRIAALTNFVPLQASGTNVVDCSVAQLDAGIEFEATGLWTFGALAGLGDPFEAPSGQVAKIGRTTGLTHGRITALELDDVKVGYDSGVLSFDNQVEIEGHGSGPFSRGGDSGSLIFDMANTAIGLLFAGSTRGGSNGKGLTFANPMPTVLDELEVDLIV